MDLKVIFMVLLATDIHAGCLEKCKCDMMFGLFDCSYDNLRQVPYFLASHAAYAYELNLEGNAISSLSNSDLKDISKWKHLKSINLKQNPVECSELLELKNKYIVMSDCPEGERKNIIIDFLIEC